MSRRGEFQDGDQVRQLSAKRGDGDRWVVQLGDERLELPVRAECEGFSFYHDGRWHRAYAASGKDALQLRVDGQTWRLPFHRRGAAAAEGGSGETLAPMTGTILSVAVAVGDPVAEGDPLLVLSAMKMEHKLTAEIAGTVKTLAAAAGDSVEAGSILVQIEPAQAD